jgi:uncharacterized protein
MKRTTDKLCRLSMIAMSIFAFIGYASAQNGGGSGETKLITAVACYLGTSGRIDMVRARTLFIEASNENDPLATMWLARSYFKGRAGFTKDEQRAQNLAKNVIESIEQLARDGNVHAMTLWASALDEGLGVTANQAEAVSWYRKAAEQGDVLAMSNLAATFFETGDKKQAEIWYRQAAVSGDLYSIVKLGRLLEDKGKIEEAVDLFRRGAEGGEHWGMLNLGYAYENGQGVKQDLQEAIAWYRKAVEGGNANAMNALGCLYCEGKGVSHDIKEAKKYLLMAAELGNNDAMYNMGFVLYRHGDDPKDKAQAIEWLKKAALAGNTLAKRDLERLENENTQENHYSHDRRMKEYHQDMQNRINRGF